MKEEGEGRGGRLTGCFDKGVVVLPRQERVGQVPEELLEQTGHAVYVVEEVLGVSKVEVARSRVCGRVSRLQQRYDKTKSGGETRTCVEEILELVDVRYRPRQPVYPFEIQTKQIHGLHALIHHHWDRQPVPLIEPSQIDTEYRSRWSQLRRCRW